MNNAIFPDKTERWCWLLTLAAIVVGILRIIYIACVLILTGYAISTVYILYTYVRHWGKRRPLPILKDNEWPKVTVQLPLFNERYVARRIIDAVAQLDYPRDRLHIQVLDDSIDDTTDLLAPRIAQLRAEGLRIDLIHRTNRQGYKAGALAEALPLTDGEFFAIFDADFIPAPDFLRKTVPYFKLGDDIGVVQARWGHLNANDNVLTRAQALAIDGHFGVEQFARCNSGLIFSFNGTCGLWRRACIESAGGWSADTLTEDFDLSFRAHMKGWHFYYVRDVMCPGELPAQMTSYKQQQTRWAKGSTQVMVKLTLPLLFSKLGWRKKVMGVLQLFQYGIQLVILASLLLAPVMLLTNSLQGLPLAPLSILSLAAPLLFVLGQQALKQDWRERTIYFPMLMVLSSGMVVNNSRAAIEAFSGKKSEFIRTPKFRGANAQSTRTWQHSKYTMMVGKGVILEIVLAIYALGAAALTYQVAPSFVLYFCMYAFGLLMVAGWSLTESWIASRPTPPPSASVEPIGSAGK
jgi:cellulose synthase/poly-beta-1,6-N-acetylglucosamine synthase-like glycosyltransferase